MKRGPGRPKKFKDPVVLHVIIERKSLKLIDRLKKALRLSSRGDVVVEAVESIEWRDGS